MKKQLKASGNGWELYLGKQLLKLLGYNPKETKILITTKLGVLYFEPIKENEDIYAHNMVRKLQKSGGSYAIYIPIDLIDVLEIDPAYDYIDIQIDEDKMIVKKYKDK